jgi:hypothetical protein
MARVDMAAQSRSDRTALGSGVSARPVYFISDRPEAYELWGEIGHDQAARIGQLIAERAAQRFPEVEFAVDGAWHTHPNGMAHVDAFIDDNLAAWVAEVLER